MSVAQAVLAALGGLRVRMQHVADVDVQTVLVRVNPQEGLND